MEDRIRGLRRAPACCRLMIPSLFCFSAVLLHRVYVRGELSEVEMMKRNILIGLFAFIVAVGWGCAATVGTGYSILDTIPPGEAPIPMTQGPRPVVAIGPIGVPGYVLRAATVLETTWSTANISVADQKAAVLNSEIPRVITVNMERLLASKGLAVTKGGTGSNADYRIAVDLSSFDVRQFSMLETKGQWALYQRNSAAPLLVKDISLSTPVAGSDDAAVRAAMSMSLADLTTMIVRDFEGFLGTR